MANPTGLYYGDNTTTSVVIEPNPVATAAEPAGDLAGRKAAEWTDQANEPNENQGDVLKAILVTIAIIALLAAIGGLGCTMVAVFTRSDALFMPSFFTFIGGMVVTGLTKAMLSLLNKGENS